MKQTMRVMAAAVLVALAAPAHALTDSETNASIPFSFANPGARSLGMGGAFIGLGDDATAAYTNPAGLTQPRQTEISLEARHTSFSLPFVDGGTAVANGGNFDGSGLRSSDADNSKNNLSFLSVLVPRDSWAIAFYRHEVLNYSAKFSSQGATVSFPEISQDVCGGPCAAILRPYDADSRLKIVNYGVSAAWKLSDRLSLGAGVSYYDFMIRTSDARATVDPATGLPTGGIANVQAQRGDDNGFGANLGLRYQFSDQWSLGLVYRHAPKFDYDASSTVFLDEGATSVTSLSDVGFGVPDSYGVGVSFRPTDTLVLNLDVNRVRYSELTDGMRSLFQYLPEDSDGLLPVDDRRLSVSDGTEIHFGGEYTFLTKVPFSVRAGVWHDPRHSIRYRGEPGNGATNESFNQVSLATLFSQGRGSQTHYAGGMGLAFEKFQVDFGFDLSKEVDTFSLSGIYRF
jgi:long-subunit fatty acid transport protein